MRLRTRLCPARRQRRTRTPTPLATPQRCTGNSVSLQFLSLDLKIRRSGDCRWGPCRWPQGVTDGQPHSSGHGTIQRVWRETEIDQHRCLRIKCKCKSKTVWTRIVRHIFVGVAAVVRRSMIGCVRAMRVLCMFGRVRCFWGRKLNRGGARTQHDPHAAFAIGHRHPASGHTCAHQQGHDKQQPDHGRARMAKRVHRGRLTLAQRPEQSRIFLTSAHRKGARSLCRAPLPAGSRPADRRNRRQSVLSSSF